jgi:hypothetical protein
MPILQQAAQGQPQPQAQPQAQAPQGGDTIGGELGGEPATQQEQEAKDQVVMAGYKILFEDDKTHDQAIKKLGLGASNPAQAIADYTKDLIIGLDDSSGGTIPEEVILPAAGELIENVSELVKAANLFPVDEAVMNHAMQLMLPPLAEQYGVGMEEIQELMSTMDEGTLEQVRANQEGYANKQPPLPQQQQAAEV